MQHTNALIHESSPYLLQHAHNPVNWFAWNEKTWQKAYAENKLAIVSIGYSACHWCHVMEHESFEDTEVAALMNAHFVSIKVDREERPDIDQIYMEAAQLISGRGGWPLNAICLPDGRPVYAGTYFPKQNWMQILQFFEYEFKHNLNKMQEQAENLTYGISASENFLPKEVTTFTNEHNNNAAQSLLNTQDFTFGGRMGAPKFPMPINYIFLLQHHYFTQSNITLQAITTTLNNMLAGGIYDQIGGGFARYSVDAQWQIPHFEKMLYDNAQLVSLYAQAFQLTKNNNYERIVNETLAFVARELTGKYSNFYAALDADSDGEEGKFYVWNYKELQQLLGAEFEAFQEIYSITENGNFEGQNHLQLRHTNTPHTKQINRWKQILLTERNKRNRPALDDKTLTAWNALMLKGYLDAYAATGIESYLNTAIQNGNFILQHQHIGSGALLRCFKNNKSNIHGFLDDYAFSIDAFLSLYETTFETSWLAASLQLCHYCLEHFYDHAKQIFYYTDQAGETLIARKTETSDNVIPASNSAMAKNLYKLGLMTENQDYINIAKQTTQHFIEAITTHASFYANWAILLRWLTNEPYIIAITGNQATDIKRQFGQHYLPHCFFVGGKTNLIPALQNKPTSEKALIYICKNRTCGLPAHHVEEALQQIQS